MIGQLGSSLSGYLETERIPLIVTAEQVSSRPPFRIDQPIHVRLTKERGTKQPAHMVRRPVFVSLAQQQAKFESSRSVVDQGQGFTGQETGWFRGLASSNLVVALPTVKKNSDPEPKSIARQPVETNAQPNLT